MMRRSSSRRTSSGVLPATATASAGNKAAAKEQEKIDALFAQYVDRNEESCIGPEGIEALCQDLGLSPTDIQVLLPNKCQRVSEIDEIFGNKKRKVVVAEQVESALGAGADQEKNTKKKKKKVKESDAIRPVLRSSNQSYSASVGKPRKKTIDGYRIYTEDEIGFGKKNAGGTPLCPFDCDCCF